MLDALTLRRTLGHFATGVTVVSGVTADGRRIGMTVNSFCSVSLDPPLVLWNIARTSPHVGFFSTTGRYAINVLARHQEHVGLQFSRPVEDRFAGVAASSDDWGVPLLDGAVAHLVCDAHQQIDAGDHRMLIGRVVGYAAHGGDPLVFCQGKMGALIAA